MKSAPLRFLLAILVLWIGVRAAVLMPGWSAAVDPAPAAAAAPSRTVAASSMPAAAPATPALAGPEATAVARRPGRDRLGRLSLAEPPPARASAAYASTPVAAAFAAPEVSKAGGAAPAPLIGLPPPAQPLAGRWSLAMWLLVRDDSGDSALAPGGSLGGSQAGARLLYALGGGLALSGRLYLPLRHASAAEAAAGIDWRPVRAVPINLLAERRQRLGRSGRNAFALTLYGGASRNLTARLRLDLYGQAGIVGLRSRDRFADGAVRLVRRLGPAELGAGAWGAAQPGTARLDAGPSLSWRLPVPTANLRLQADWRFRVAGDAAPGSGPALTLAADF